MINFSELEKKILKSWQDKKIFRKTLKKKSPKGDFVFYDGPPFATGTPHYGHLVGGTLKDVIPRFRTMQGYHVERKWGWDCHGLPIENIVEQKLNLKSHQDIDKIGIEKFCQTCRSVVFKYAEEWREIVDRMGRWVDMDNDYRTMRPEYMESIWWVFKSLWDKDLIYEGYKSMHICPRCETTLSNFEVTQNYKDVHDLSVTAEFEVKYPEGKTGRGAGALILNSKNEILLIRRNENNRRITWALPGGKVEKNETFREALEREVEEELGVKVESARAFSRHPDIFEGRLFETVCYETEIQGEPKIMLPKAMDKMSWFPLDKLPEINYPPSDSAINFYKNNPQNKVSDDIAELPKVFILAWTTTPWTLIGNVALAVGKDIDYTLVEDVKNDKKYILSEDYYQKNKENFGKVIEKVKSKDLVGLKYKPLFDYYKTDLENKENGWQVYEADFVTTDEGTGIVHVAPAFGEEDMLLGQEKKLPFIQHVDMTGRFKPEVTDWAGESVKAKDNPQATDKKIIEKLENENKLFSEEEYLHSYPHCWRCDTPLLNYATSSWFVKVTDLKKDLIKNNQKINWVPAHIKDGRFGKWLEQAKDWAISRSRFWGAPLPVWKCEKCEEVKVLGSIEELKKETEDKITKIILLRHGESEKNIKDIFDSSNENFSLTAKGKKQAQEAAGKLKNIKINRIYSSPVLRAFQTAEAVAKKKGLAVEKADELAEIKSGDWEQKNRYDESIKKERELYKSLTAEEQYIAKRGNTGESWKDCEERVYSFVKKAIQKNSGKTILIVTHQAPIIYFFKAIKDLSVREAVMHFGFDLLQKCAYPINVYIDNKTLKQIDIHKHRVDKLTLECPKCQGEMKRVEEVLDCWFESGSMPYAQSHYPFENKEKFEKDFPAQFIAEGQDQTRGWFYTLLVLSTALFNKPAYLNVIVNGLILAEDGKKMAKRLKNYPEPAEVMDKYGADVMRFYLINGPVVKAEELRFNEREVREIFNKTVGLIWNVLSFYKLFEDKEIDFNKKSSHVLDKWIEVKLNLLIQEVTNGLESYDLMKATKPIVEFINELSTWYLRRSRERFKSQDAEVKEEAQATLYRVLFTFSKVLAPFTPFIAEKIYQDLGSKEESVHLENWPVTEKLIREEIKLIKDMDLVRQIVEAGLRERAEAGIKVRQPLNFYSTSQVKSLSDQLKQIVSEELNVKEVKFGEDKLDTELTDELREEGILRELIRSINNLRRERKLTVNDKIHLAYQTDSKELKTTINKYQKELLENTRSLSIKELSNENVERQQIKEIKMNELLVKIVLIRD
jgi:isoleucyl-tRNA synthetase